MRRELRDDGLERKSLPVCLHLKKSAQKDPRFHHHHHHKSFHHQERVEEMGEKGEMQIRLWWWWWPRRRRKRPSPPQWRMIKSKMEKRGKINASVCGGVKDKLREREKMVWFGTDLSVLLCVLVCQWQVEEITHTHTHTLVCGWWTHQTINGGPFFSLKWSLSNGRKKASATTQG